MTKQQRIDELEQIVAAAGARTSTLEEKLRTIESARHTAEYELEVLRRKFRDLEEQHRNTNLERIRVNELAHRQNDEIQWLRRVVDNKVNPEPDTYGIVDAL